MRKEKQFYFIFGTAERGLRVALLVGRPASAAYDTVRIWGFFESVNDKYALIQVKKRYKNHKGLSCTIYRLTPVSPLKIGKKRIESMGDSGVLIGLEREFGRRNRHDYLWLSDKTVKEVDMKKYQIYYGEKVYVVSNPGTFHRRRRRTI